MSKIADLIAADLPQGGTLTCTVCGTVRKLKKGDTATFFAHGWPKCCNYTMRWDTKVTA